MNKRRALMGLLALVGVSLAADANAWGFYTPPHGVRGLGRGGAMVASESDLNALWYNPALLAGIEGTHVLVDVGLSASSASFARAPRLLPNGELRFYEEVDNEASALLAPQLGIASDFGLDGWVFAFGAFAPNGAVGNYPEDGPQRYTLVDSEGSVLVTLELAAAWQVNDWLRVGLGLQNSIIALRLINVESGFPGTIGDPEDPDFDILLQSELSSAFVPSANMGLWAKAPGGVEFGLGLQLPMAIKDDDARVKTRLPTSPLFDDAVVKGETVAAELDLPMILRGGVRYAQPLWDVELDVVVEFWSIHDTIKTTPKDIDIEGIPGIGTISVGPLNVERNFQDALSVRLGGDYQVVPGVVTVRAGGLFEQSAIPTKTLSVLQIDMDKVALGIGASFAVSPAVTLDVGYAHLFYLGAEVTDSEIIQLNPTNPEGSIVVGNGTYSATADLLGVGMRLGF